MNLPKFQFLFLPKRIIIAVVDAREQAYRLDLEIKKKKIEQETDLLEVEIKKS